jgi:hypothetical protein
MPPGGYGLPGTLNFFTNQLNSLATRAILHYPKNRKGCVVTVKLSSKLDYLQEMARACTGEAHKAYLIALLAEHAQEGECTEGFLAWARSLLEGEG